MKLIAAALVLVLFCSTSFAATTTRSTRPATTRTTRPATTLVSLAPVPADPPRQPALVGQYFKNINQLSEVRSPASQPFLVRVDSSVDFRRSSGQFYKTKL